MLLLRAEDYHRTPKPVLAKVLQFLRLDVPQTEDSWASLLSGSVALAGPRPKDGLPPIPDAMESLLRRFYAPHLEQLVGLLQGEPDHSEWVEWSTKRYREATRSSH